MDTLRAVFDFNKATLSGAMDVIAVRYDDGTWKASPFHVRFGMFKVLRPKEKRVYLTVNDVRIDLEMRLGKEGEAFFLRPKGRKLEDVAAGLLNGQTVPGPASAQPTGPPLSTSVDVLNSSDGFLPSSPPRTGSVAKRTDSVNSTEEASLPSPLIPLDSELVMDGLGSLAIDTGLRPASGGVSSPTQSPTSPLRSSSRGVPSSPLRIAAVTVEGADQPIPRSARRLSISSLPDVHVTGSGSSVCSPLMETASVFSSPGHEHGSQSLPTSPMLGPLDPSRIEQELKEDGEDAVNSLLDFRASSQVVPRSTKRRKRRANAKRGLQTPQQGDGAGSLTSAEVLQRTPQSLPSRSPAVLPLTAGAGEIGKGNSGSARPTTPSTPLGSKSAEVAPSVPSADTVVAMPDIELPPATSQGWYHYFMPSRRGVKTAATADVPTPKPEGAPPTPTQPPVIQRSLTVPAGDSSSRASVTSDEDRSDIGSESYDSDATYDRFAFLLDPTPTSEQLNSMGLRLGSNTIQFDVYSGSGRSQKRSTVTSKIFVWTPRSRVVISDIDGTITKSDILGHIYYYIGRDWTHNGVAKLFTMIKRHGYEIMYLTSRAIGQSDSTRQYLQSVKQEGDASLPAGPVITSPDRLIAAFTREVIHRKPHEFKIECLKGIRRLFPANRNPFYAGFGNRDTDMLSYREAGVNPGKIFLINPKGEIGHLNRTYVTSYSNLSSLVDSMFPNVRGDVLDATTAVLGAQASPLPATTAESISRRFGKPVVLDEQFNSFNFWRTDHGLILDDPDPPTGNVAAAKK